MSAWQGSAVPCRLSAGSVSGQPHSNWWWCRDIDYPLLDAKHSLCTATWSGTPCRTTSAHSRTMSPLDRAWKPGFSLDTSEFSASETFVIIALYKSTFTVPYHTIPYRNTPLNVLELPRCRRSGRTTKAFNCRAARFCSAANVRGVSHIVWRDGTSPYNDTAFCVCLMQSALITGLTHNHRFCTAVYLRRPVRHSVQSFHRSHCQAN